MKRLLVLAMVGVLGGCSSPTMYGPLTGQGGYSETRVNETTYEVRGTVNFETLPEYAEKVALTRAADLACSKGYRYFRVLDKRLQNKSGEYAYEYMTISYLTIQLIKEPEPTDYDVVIVLREMLKDMPTIKHRIQCPLN